MASIAVNIHDIQEQIKAACLSAGRPLESVRLIAVSKTKPASLIKEAFLAGQIEFGESYVQEFLEKYEDPILEKIPVKWHFIGHLQSNKVRFIIDKVTLVHGIDKLSTAEELSKRAVQHNLHVDYLLEVNTSGETSKYGMQHDEVLASAETLSSVCRISTFVVL